MNKEKTRLDWLEGRRRRAWELKQQGWKQQDIAAALGVTKGAVSQWMRCAREGGGEALRRHPPTGPTPKLTRAQMEQLPGLIAPGAEAYGYRGDVWSTKRVAEVIWRTFGVSYHPGHVSRLLRAVHLSVQQPVERATQRDEQAIAVWQTEGWPALKKKPPRKSARSSG
jgi:transposase